MDQPFVLESESHQRWTLYPPVDPYGDGYVAHLRVELRDDGLHAETTATVDGDATARAADLAAFMRQLADDWRGWHGSRVWHAVEHEMTVEAAHDGRAHVTLAVTLRRHRRPYADDAWSARAVFTVEAGEEMNTLARDIQSLLAPAPTSDR